MRSYAVIPPLMLKTPQIIFQNENGAMDDMEIEFKVSCCQNQALRNLLIYYFSCFFFIFEGTSKLKRVDSW